MKCLNHGNCNGYLHIQISLTFSAYQLLIDVHKVLKSQADTHTLDINTAWECKQTSPVSSANSFSIAHSWILFENFQFFLISLKQTTVLFRKLTSPLLFENTNCGLQWTIGCMWLKRLLVKKSNQSKNTLNWFPACKDTFIFLDSGVC